MWKKENLRRRRLYTTKKKTRAQSTLRNGERLEQRIVLNAAPVLDDTASPALLSIAEDAGAPSGQVGTFVSSLIDTGGTHSNFSDTDGDLPGIAITGVNLQGGALWYSSDDGSTWLDVGAVSDEAPRLLAADATTRVYFEPAADFSGTVSDVISFKAWDRNVIWQQLGADIDGEAADDGSGYSVSMSADGQTVAIGAYLNDGNGSKSGHVRMYDWTGSGWSQRGADIDGEAASDYSGYSVSMSADGQTVAIGAYSNDGNGINSGHVRMYDWTGSGWSQRGADIDGEAADDGSGYSVSMSADGQTVAIGAYLNDGNGINSGHVRMYDWTGSGWSQRGADIDGEAALDYSGRSVSMSADGQTVAIGAYLNDGNGSNSGHVRMYDWTGSGWSQRGADIDGEAASDYSGRSVSMSADGQTVAIGANSNDGNGINSGHVRMYDWTGSGWSQRGADIDGEAADDGSGKSVSMSADGQTVAIGANSNDGNGINSGHVRMYDWTGSGWSQRGADIDGEAADDGSGYSVSMSADGQTVAIGAYSNDGNGINSGHVRIYQSSLLTDSFSTVTDTISVDVTDVNDPPVNTLPATATTIVDQPIAFSSYRGNAISIGDADAGSNPVEVTLSVDQGSISLINPNPGNALTYSAGDGSADATMTFQGTVADINTALDWVSYQPAANRYFQWQVEDGGNGNWYQYVTDGLTWDAAKTQAENLGGHLATVTSAEERRFLLEALHSVSDDIWMGGLQDRSAIDFEEPINGWQWVTGEPWSYANWDSTEPGNAGDNEHHLSFRTSNASFHDSAGSTTRGYLIEHTSDPRPANHLDATLTITTDDLGNSGAGGALVDTDSLAIEVVAAPDFQASPTHPMMPATLDDDFGTNGTNVLSITSGVDYIQEMTVLDDGKILAIGAVNDRFGIMRFNADMTLDNTFGSGGGTQVDFGAGAHAKSFAIDSSDRIIVVGHNRIARFTPDGALDTSFGSSGSVVDDHVHRAYDVAIQPDGKFVVVGRDNASYHLSRYYADGTLDVQWSFDGVQYGMDYGRGVLVRDDGDILLFGKTYANGGDRHHFGHIRISSTGTKEIDHRYDFGSNEFVHSMLPLPNDQFLVVGRSDNDLVVAKFVASGGLDLSFGVDGWTELPVLNGVDDGYRATLAADGKILISGYSENGVNTDLTVVRLNQDGSVDNTFGTNGSVAFDISGNDYGYAIASLADGKILVAGRAGDDVAFVRLLGDSDQTAAAANQAPVNSVPAAQTTLVNQPLAFTAYRGNLISISDADSGANAVEVTLTADTGTITLLNPDPSGRLTYLAGDGIEDATMTFTGTVADINTAMAWVSFRPEADYLGDATITITTSDLGNVGLGGAQVDTDTITVTSEAVPAFAASPTHPTLPSALDSSLDSDGKQVLSITSGVDYIQEMTVLDDGKILAIGAVNDRFGIMRFNADMTLDNTFGSGGGTQVDFGAGAHAKSFAIDSSDRIIVVGHNRIARFTPDGALDTSFGSSGSVVDDHVHRAYDVAIQPDGKFVVVGRDNASYHLSRYYADGTLDVQWSFDGVQYGMDYGRGVLVRDDGDILLFGKTYANGGDRHHFGHIRISSTGTKEIDHRYDFGSNEFVHSMLPLPNDQFLVVGRSDNDLVVAKFVASGGLDLSFGVDGWTELPVLNGVDDGYRATLAADGKILISGYSENGVNTDLTVVRLNQDGSVDNTFGTNGSVAFDISGNDYGYAIASLADGKILVAGRAGDDVAFVRLLGDSDQTAAAANQAPVNSVPAAQTTLVNQPLAFTAYRGNLISISDADSGANAVEVTLTADTGTITLLNPDPSGRLTYLAGDGIEDATMTFTGTVADINTAMAWVSFRPEADYLGDATITITTSDLGNVGLGGAQVDTDTITVTSEAVPAFAASPTHPTLPSALDSSLDSDGKQVLSITSGVDYIQEMTVLDDGKILAIGAVNDRFGIMRFNADMTLDNTFGSGGGTQVDFGAGAHAKSFAIDSSDRIIVVGHNRIARFTPDGALDTSFGSSGSVVDDHVHRAYDVAIQPDGKFVVVGRDNASYHLSRYYADGTLDVQWSFDGVQYGMDYGRGVLVRDDGDILLFGKTYANGGDRHHFGHIRISSTGTKEIDHRYDFGSNEFVHSMLPLPNDQFLVVGRSDNDLVVAKFVASGGLDLSFGVDGWTELPVLNGVDDGYRATLAADGKILISGYSENGVNTDLTVVRLNQDGSVDNTFGTNGSVAFDISGNDYGYAIASLADGKILVAGRAGDDVAFVRLLGDSDQTAAAANQAPVNSVPAAQTTLVNQPLAFTAYRGNLISISDADSGANAVEVTLTADTGTITLLNPDPSGRLTYLAGDGIEDATMTFTGTVADINTAMAWVSFRPEADYLGDATITITTSDLGNVGLGGAQVDTDTITVTSEAVPAFAASPTHPTLPSALDSSLDSDGKQVLSITSGVDYIQEMTVLDDGKILAIGAVNDRFGIMRFNADMTLDNTFGSGGGTQVDFGAGAHAKSFAIDSSDRIIVVGHNRIARFTPDGALDTSFGSSGSVVDDHVHRAYDVAIQPDGKFVVVGRDNASYHLSRYYADGTLDVQWSFDGVQYGMDYGRGVLVRDDGDILLFGKTYANGGDRHHFGHIRISSTGTKEIDHRYDFGSNEFVHSMLPLPNDQFLVVGRSDNDLVVAKFVASGGLDLSFGVDGWTELPVLNGVDDGYRATLAADGKILISGYSENGVNTDLTVVRLNQDGSVDNTFGTNGSVAFDISGNDYGYAIASLADGKILVAGRAGDDVAFVRLLGDSDQTAAAANQAPVNSVPAAQTTLVNQPLAFTAYRGNLISISDADSGANAVEVTLTADTGTITLLNPDPSGRLTYLAGDGIEDATMTFTGTVADINTAMAWVSFRPDAPVPSPYFQWTADSGGNDHWYEYVSTPLNWDAAQADAVNRGGTLATLTTEAETNFMASQELSGDLWIGGYQDRSGFTFSEPLAGWTWITGEAWDYDAWDSSEPNNGLTADNEHHLMLRTSLGRFHDNNGSVNLGYFVEYTSDPRSGSGDDSGHSLTITTNDLGSVGAGGSQSDTDVIAITVSEPPAFAASPTHATLPATLDDSFDGDGIQVLALTPNVDYIHDMTVLDDGKILAIGAVNDRFGIMRFNADMTLDNTFGSGGGTQVDFGTGAHAKSFAIDSSDRIIVVGHNHIARFTPDGALDASFSGDGSVIDNHVYRAYDVAIQPDGKFVVVGRDNANYHLSRYYADGTLDVQWSFDGVQYGMDYGRGVLVRDDGDILLFGKTYANGGDRHHFGHIRISSTGTKEIDHRYDFGSNEFVHSMLPLPNDQFLVVGRSDNDLVVAKFVASGGLDLSFGVDGWTELPVLNGVDDGYRATLAADGKILISGYSENGVNTDLTVVRLNQDGSVDNTFGTNGSVAFDISGNDYGYAIASLADGKILVAGRAGDDVALVRLLGDYDYVSNNQPTLDALSDLEIERDAAEQTISLSGITAGGENQVLRVTATSDNQSLIPDPAVTYTSPNATGSLAFTPAAGQMGTATITVTVEDAGNDDDFGTTEDNGTYSLTFDITVNHSSNETPTLDTLSDVSLQEDAAPSLITLSGLSAGIGETEPFEVTATTSAAAIAQPSALRYDLFSDTWSFDVIPTGNAFGDATISVTVTDPGVDGDLNTVADNQSITRSFEVSVAPVNDLPILPVFNHLSIFEDSMPLTISFAGVSAGGGETQPLSITAVSDNTSLIPDPTVSYSSPNATGALTFHPVANQSGSAEITVTLEDGGLDNDLGTPDDNGVINRTVIVAVAPVNDMPTLDELSDINIDEDDPEHTINLTGVSAGASETQVLSVTAVSDNTGLIPDPTVVFDGQSSTGTLTFTPVADQSGTATITVTVEDGGLDNDLGTPEDNGVINHTIVVRAEAVNDAPTGAVIVDGIAEEDQVLTPTNNLADIDGLGVIAYEWSRDGAAISGATASTYTLTQDDVGSTITVTARYTDNDGTLETVTSSATSPVLNVNDVPTGDLTIDGSATQNAVLSANTSTVQDEDGLGAFAYQWLRDGVLISAAVSSTYTLTQDDVDSQISVQVDYTDNEGTAETLPSAQTSAVVNVNDAPVLDPSVSLQLASVLEDSAAPSGQVGSLVSDLIDAGGAHNNFSDGDGDSPGIAITGVNLQGGSLWFSNDDGSTWLDVGAVSDGSPRLLAADATTRVYFQPAADFSGSISDVISFKAWDRTLIWQQLGHDIDGEAAGDLFGRSVSLSADGQTVAIGAHFNDGTGLNSGHTRIYHRTGSTWTQLGADIDGEAAGDNSGRSVSLSSDGQAVAIGGFLNDGNGASSGHTRIYHWTGFAWTQMGADIDGEAAEDQSGFSISLSADGQTVAIGAHFNDGNGLDSGHTRIYRWTGTAWAQVGADIDGEVSGDNSGFSVSLSSDGQTVAVGAYYNDGNGSNSGHTRIFRWTGSAWTQLGEDIDGEAAGDHSSRSVSLSSDGQTVAVGAFFNDGNGASSGHTRIYRWTGSAWTQVGADIDGEAAVDQSSRSLSLSSDGQTVAVGAFFNDGNGTNSGHTRIYRWTGSVWTQLGADIDGEVAGDLSGFSVSLSSDGQTVVIGAYNNDGNGTNSGHVRIFQFVPSVSTVTDTLGITVNAVNDTPTLGLLSDLVLPEDSQTQIIDITGITAGGGETQPLQVTVTSSNPSLISDPTLTSDAVSAEGSRSLAFVPLPDQYGIATITVTVEDGGLDLDLNTAEDNAMFSRTFDVTVTPDTDSPPTQVTPHGRMFIHETLSGDSLASYQLPAVNVNGEAINDLPTRITVTSSDTALIPDPTVLYASADVPSSLSFTPVANANGTATLSIQVEDGGPDNDFATTEDNRQATHQVVVNVLEVISNRGSAILAKDNTENLYVNTRPVVYHDQQQAHSNIAGFAAIGATSEGGENALLVERASVTNRLVTDDAWRINGLFHSLQNESSPVLDLSAREVSSTLNIVAVAGAYEINGVQNPTLVVRRGQIYNFNLNVADHPFFLQTTGNGFQPENTFNRFFQGQGRTAGEYMWIVPADAPDELYYQCEFHPVMFGKIIIVD